MYFLTRKINSVTFKLLMILYLSVNVHVCVLCVVWSGVARRGCVRPSVCVWGARERGCVYVCVCIYIYIYIYMGVCVYVCVFVCALRMCVCSAYVRARV